MNNVLYHKWLEQMDCAPVGNWDVQACTLVAVYSGV